jgi:hypothetical protein
MHFKQFMWRQRYEEEDIFEKMLKHIAEFRQV